MCGSVQHAMVLPGEGPGPDEVLPMNVPFRSSLLPMLLLVSATAVGNGAINFRVQLTGDQEVPPVDTDASGFAILHVDQALSAIRFRMVVTGADDILGAAGAHLHCAPAGANGPVVAFLAGSAPPGFGGRIDVRATLDDGSILNPACGANIAELVGSMLDGNVYINVHSLSHGGGEVRGQVN